MKLGIVKWLRRKDESRLAKPDKKVNLEMIRILRTFEEAHTGGKEDHCEGIGSESEEPDRWAQYVSIQLKRSASALGAFGSSGAHCFQTQ